MDFDWDEANEDHIARHGVNRIEVETVLLDAHALMMDATVEDDEVRYLQVGSTARGRLIVVAFTIRGEAVRPITAFDAGRATSSAYRKGRFGD